jgi:hypothetical protein
VGRFAGLGPEWFWEDTFQLPRKTCWAREQAAEVARLRAGGLTLEELAVHFGKSVPTIRAALKRAGGQQAGPARAVPPQGGASPGAASSDGA